MKKEREKRKGTVKSEYFYKIQRLSSCLVSVLNPATCVTSSDV
jgi:hypothetical protein